MLQPDYLTTPQNRYKRYGLCALVLVLFASAVLSMQGCSSSVSGTYQSSGAGIRFVTDTANIRIKEFTLYEDGTVTCVLPDAFKPLSESLSNSFTGVFTVKENDLLLSFGDTSYTATIKDDAITFNTSEDGAIVYHRVEYLPPEMTVILIVFICWVIISIFQYFLAYELVAKRARAQKGYGGFSLYSDLELHKFYAIIPGLVIFMWLNMKKAEKSA